MSETKKSDKVEVERLRGPEEIPVLVRQYLTNVRKMDADLVRLLKAVIRKGTSGQAALNIRVFDEADALANKVQVKDYTSLDQRPDLILYEGSFDEGSKQVTLEEKKKVNYDVPIFTETEMRQKIEGLSEPGSTIFFYLAAGRSHGGPLGMGAAVVELNPNYGDKKQKKYNVYNADVVDMQPVDKQKWFSTDKTKEIADWFKTSHRKRQYSS